MTFQTRQTTLDLIERIVTETCGVQKQESYEAIATVVDDYVDGFIREEQANLENLKTFATQMV